MSERSVKAYRRVYLESASPAKILVELLLRLTRDLELARTRISAGDFGGKGLALSHALEIVGQLQAALDHAAAPQLCGNLASVYGFIELKISEANMKLSVTAVDHALRALAPIHAAFAQAVAEVTSGAVTAVPRVER